MPATSAGMTVDGSSLLPAAATARWFYNKPLMACREHWKTRRVLPMFRVHRLAFDPGFPDDTRRNAARSADALWEYRYG
jgi:hypothetical protein